MSQASTSRGGKRQSSGRKSLAFSPPSRQLFVCPICKAEKRSDHLNAHIQNLCHFKENGEAVDPVTIQFKKLNADAQKHTKYCFDNNVSKSTALKWKNQKQTIHEHSHNYFKKLKRDPDESNLSLQDETEFINKQDSLSESGCDFENIDFSSATNIENTNIEGFLLEKDNDYENLGFSLGEKTQPENIGLPSAVNTYSEETETSNNIEKSSVNIQTENVDVKIDNEEVQSKVPRTDAESMFLKEIRTKVEETI